MDFSELRGDLRHRCEERRRGHDIRQDYCTLQKSGTVVGDGTSGCKGARTFKCVSNHRARGWYAAKGDAFAISRAYLK